MRRFWCGVILVLVAMLAARGDDPAAGEAILVDVDGKEHKLTGLKFTTGTRRLAWLADPKGTTDDEKKGPQALELREMTSAMPITPGIVTLIPVTSLESAKYDYEKDVVSLSVKGLKEPLAGLLGYAKTNILSIGGTNNGKTTAFTGGVRAKTAVKTAAFSGAESLPKRKAGITWNIQILKTKADQPQADTPTLKAHNLKVLYSFPDGSQQLIDGIPVRK